MQAAEPKGIVGSILGVLMNLMHTKFYVKCFNECELKSNSIILDIGCGGGRLIKKISKWPSVSKVIGIDRSAKMVGLSEKINKNEIKKGKVEIKKASLPELPFHSNLFDFITAFETIQFWPDLDKSLNEVKRILTPGGAFMIINRFPSPKSKWYNKVQIKNEEQYKNVLKQAEFEIIDIKYKDNWIMIKTHKHHEN